MSTAGGGEADDPTGTAPGDAGVVVLGAEPEDVAERAAALRAGGTRAAGFVGDPHLPADVAAASEMARELFGEGGGVEPL